MSHTEINLAKSRIENLVDRGSFVEMGEKITARSTDFNMKNIDTERDGVITGYGMIDGNLVYVYSQDASVMNGSVGEMHAGKIIRLYKLAMKVGAPVIGMIESGGMRLQEATDALLAVGELFTQMSLASGVIPQILMLFGDTGGGLSFLPALADFVFADVKCKNIFVNAKDTITGHDMEKADGKNICAQSGLIDYIGNEDEISEAVRELICMIPANNEDDASYDECMDSLNRLCEGAQESAQDGKLLLRLISDDEVFFETARENAKEITAGFIRLNGMTVGAAAQGRENQITHGGMKKISKLVRFCDAFGIPVLTMTNICGFAKTESMERYGAEEAGKLSYAFINATVPKVNIITGDAYGSAGIIMNSKAAGADIVYAWGIASIGMMNPAQAAKIMCADGSLKEMEAAAEECKRLQTSADAAARRGYIDAVISPEYTRKYVISAFEMLFTKREDRPSKKHGTV